MKFVYLLIPILFLFSCKSTTEKMTTTNNETIQQNAGSDSNCPDDGVCKIQVFKNKKITVLEDGIGALYSEIVSGDKIVVQYSYFKLGPEGTVDGNYEEHIYFEVPTEAKSLIKTDDGLKDINLIYIKSTYVRGEPSLYKVSKGKLTLKKSGNALSFVLDFTVEGILPRVTHIAESIVL